MSISSTADESRALPAMCESSFRSWGMLSAIFGWLPFAVEVSKDGRLSAAGGQELLSTIKSFVVCEIKCCAGFESSEFASDENGPPEDSNSCRP